MNIASGLGLVGTEEFDRLLRVEGRPRDAHEGGRARARPEIRVNVLCPGVIDTPMPQQRWRGFRAERESIFAGWRRSHVAGRLGRPDEVVAAALFLASDEASFITGAAIPVDSGITAR